MSSFDVPLLLARSFAMQRDSVAQWIHGVPENK